MSESALEKAVLWLIAENSTDHGLEMAVFHAELKGRKISKSVVRELRQKGLVRVDRVNGHHKAMYKLLPGGWEAIGEHNPKPGE